MSNRDQDTSKLFIGNLARDVTEQDLRDIFEKYGPIKDLKLISKQGNLFSFLEFNEASDAAEAIREQNEVDLKGSQIRVEFGHGGKRKRTDGCYTCGDLNHIAKDCNSSRRDNYRGGYQSRHRSRSNDRGSRRRDYSPRGSRSPDVRRRRSPDTRRRSPERRDRYRRSHSRDHRRSNSPRNNRGGNYERRYNEKHTSSRRSGSPPARSNNNSYSRRSPSNPRN